MRASLPEVQLAPMLLFGREKFDLTRAQARGELQIDLARRRSDWFLIFNPVAGTAFVSRLLAVVVHKVQRELVANRRARRGNTHGRWRFKTTQASE